MAFNIDRPVKLDGSPAIIVRDYATDNVNEGIVSDDSSLGDSHILTADPAAVDAALIQNRGYQVYGLWQVLFASGLVDENAAINIIETSDDGDGSFLFNENGNYLTGVLFQGGLTGLADKYTQQIATGDLTVHTIEPTPETLKAPKRSLVSSKERERRIKAARLRAITLYTAIVGVVAVIGLVADQILALNHRGLLKDYAALENEKSVLDMQLARTQVNRVTGLEPSSDALLSIYHMVSQLPEGSVTMSGQFNQNQFSALVEDPDLAESAKVLNSKYYDVTIDRFGAAQITWRVQP